MQSRIIVSAIIQKGTTILLGQKSPGRGPYPDTWHLPGGGVALGEETTEQAILREIREETGLQVTHLERLQWDTDLEPDKHGIETYYLFLVYRCDYATGELRAGDDMVHFEWVPLASLSRYNLNRPSKKLFTDLGYF